jgi:hypothetical protein
MEITVRYATAFAVFIGFATIASAGTTSDSTANFLSGGAISALKAAANNSSATAAQKECVDRIPDSALAPLYKELIATRLSQDDLATLESFYSSPLGVRYVAALHAGKNPPDIFSSAELSQLSSALKTIPHERLLRATSSRDPVIAERETAIVRPLVNACMRAV